MIRTTAEPDRQLPHRAVQDVLPQVKLSRKIAHQRAAILEVNAAALLAKRLRDGVEEQERESVAAKRNMVGGTRRIR